MVTTGEQAKKPNQPPYLLNWMVRGILLAAMHRNGVTRLSGSRGVTVTEFAVAFPDACSWFQILPTSDSSSCLQMFLQSLEYDGRPELFSFWACLLLTAACRQGPTWYAQHAGAIARMRKAYHHKHGVHIVPARCVQRIVRGLDHARP